jgi:hypothetical protein
VALVFPTQSSSSWGASDLLIEDENLSDKGLPVSRIDFSLNFVFGGVKVIFFILL